MRISFFKNQTTQYDVLHHFRSGLTSALEKQGINTSLLDLEHMDRASFFKAIYSSPPDYTFAFNGLQPLKDGRFLCDELEIPHIAWFVDSAHYALDFARSPFNHLITPDQISANIFKSIGAKQADFLPHAFEAHLTTSPDIERSLPIVFCGSLMDPLEIESLWKQQLPPNISKSLLEAAEKTLTSPQQTYQEAFEEIMTLHPDFFKTLSPEKITPLVISLDGYIRAKDRINLLVALKGLPVHIYGNSLSNHSWGNYLDLANGDYRISPAVNFQSAILIMKNAKIVLNSSPMFKTGAHERIFYGLGLGASVLTNETTWNQEHFSSDELLTYPSGNPKAIHDKIAELLKRPEKLQEMATKGQKKVLQEHTWDVRAKQLLNLIEIPE